jgi:hypothetical protein
MASGKRSTMEILEPHEYNARLLKEQKARGEAPNIPEPVLPNLWTTTTKKPVLRDFQPQAGTPVQPARGHALLPGGDAGLQPFNPNA